MLTVENPAELKKHVGQKLGASDWYTVDQKTIDAFAHATGDLNWIHIDVERAKREMPGGKTIAHGYLTLSLIPRLSKTVYHIQQRGKGLNYGANRVRFITPVPVGSRVRLIFECVIEIEGEAKPAMIAETIVLIMKD